MSKTTIKRILVRGLRIGVACLLSGAAIYITKDERYVALVPVLNMAGLWLRTDLKVPYMPV
jgi:hypothetical protein